MREDDEEFRHYVPLLRRIIILVAVITAVPVVLWTITAFVRTYVGPELDFDVQLVLKAEDVPRIVKEGSPSTALTSAPPRFLIVSCSAQSAAASPSVVTWDLDLVLPDPRQLRLVRLPRQIEHVSGQWLNGVVVY